jgi:uncharacterized protein with PIN domain
MACGGTLQSVEKQLIQDRIPPRTLLWCDDYFQYQRCGKLYSTGTHWQRIERVLG